MSVTPPEGRNWYEVLGVRRAASAEEIRRSYHGLARRLHPDRSAGASAAEQGLSQRRMREVNAAYEVLGDGDRRRDYDASLARSSRSRPAGPAPDRSPFGPRPGSAGGSGSSRREPLDDDEVEMGAAAWALLRWGPMVALIVIAVLLFVVTAYATVDRGTTRTTVPGPAGECVVAIEPC